MKRRTKKGRKQDDLGKASQTRKQGPLHEREKKNFIVKVIVVEQVVFCEVLVYETDVIENDFNILCNSNYSDTFKLSFSLFLSRRGIL